MHESCSECGWRPQKLHAASLEAQLKLPPNCIRPCCWMHADVLPALPQPPRSPCLLLGCNACGHLHTGTPHHTRFSEATAAWPTRSQSASNSSCCLFPAQLACEQLRDGISWQCEPLGMYTSPLQCHSAALKPAGRLQGRELFAGCNVGCKDPRPTALWYCLPELRPLTNTPAPTIMPTPSIMTWNQLRTCTGQTKHSVRRPHTQPGCCALLQESLQTQDGQ